jgi:hypothetical protein
MDSFWIYVIIAIIYVVSRALKKPENQPNDIPDHRPDRPVEYDAAPPSTSKPKPLTFEDLLREITEAKLPQQPVYETRREEPRRRVDYDDDLKEEEQDLEEVSSNKRYKEEERANSVYEEAKRQAFNRPSLEETLRVSDTDVQFGKFKVFEEQQKRNVLEDYTKDFQDAEGLKKAVVMSEILKRKF